MYQLLSLHVGHLADSLLTVYAPAPKKSTGGLHKLLFDVLGRMLYTERKQRAARHRAGPEGAFWIWQHRGAKT